MRGSLASAHRRELPTLQFFCKSRVRSVDGGCGIALAISSRSAVWDCSTVSGRSTLVVRCAVDDGLIARIDRTGFAGRSEYANPAHVCPLGYLAHG